MSTSGTVTVPSAIGTSVVLSVSGTNTLVFAQTFASALNTAKNAGTLVISNLNMPETAPSVSADTTLEYTISQAGVSATVPSTGAYLLDTATGSTTVDGSGGGDTVLAYAGALTYRDAGGSNSILFVSGNNDYLGATVPGAVAVDTVIAGSGNDTITTGSNSTMVYSGTGQANITLSDSVPAIGDTFTANDVVFLADGTNVVNAFGVRDLIVASAPRQTINGGASSLDQAQIVISSSAPGSSAGDLITANAASLGIFDYAGGNTVIGGTGAVYLVANTTPGVPLADTVQAGAGAAYLFGADGSAFTFSSTAPGQISAFVAGAGAETLDASAAAGQLVLFGSSSGSDSVSTGVGEVLFVGGVAANGATASATINQGTGLVYVLGASGDAVAITSQTSGAGDLFTAGAGNETLNAASFGGTLYAYAYNPADSNAGSMVSESIRGGAGSNLFFTGAGIETLVGGSGIDDFQLTHTLDGLGATITIYNYQGAAGDFVSFAGFTATDVTKAMKSEKAATNPLVGTQITLSDKTTVLFVDVSVGSIVFHT